MSDIDAIAVLKGSTLFGDFSKPALETLLAYFDVMEGSKGDRLYEQDDEGGGLYIVAAGTVMAKVKDIDGTERAVSRLDAPESFGELALLLRGQRLVSIEAASPVTLFELSFESFRRLKRRNPDLCLLLIMAIVRRLGHVLDDSRDIIQRLLLRQFVELDG
jgi:CRP-like cAMP-binding protein